MSISGIGNYAIESFGKFTPICSSSFSLIKQSSTRQHLCTNYETGISVTESADTVESSWILTIDEVYNNHYSLSNLFSLKNTIANTQEESSETIIYDGISALPTKYYNVTKPDALPALGDTLLVTKLINTKALAKDNSSNLELNHKFYGTFYDNTGEQYFIQINKMRRISGLSINIDSPMSISFITDDIIVKQKTTEIVSLLLPEIPTDWIQIGEETTLHLYGKVIIGNPLERNLLIRFDDGVPINQLITSDSNGNWNTTLTLNSNAAINTTSNISIEDEETSQILYEQSINIIGFNQSVISIDNPNGFVSGTNNNVITGSGPSGIPITLLISYGGNSFSQIVTPVEGIWSSSPFSILSTQSSVQMTIQATANVFPSATRITNIVKRTWNALGNITWPITNIYYSYGNPPNSPFTLRIRSEASGAGSILHEIINTTNNDGMFWQELDIPAGPQLYYELITNNGTFYGNVLRNAIITPTLTITSSAPYYSKSFITGTVTASIGEPVIIGYRDTSVRFINYKTFINHNGTINFSLEIYPNTSNQQSAGFSSDQPLRLYAITDSITLEHFFTVSPSLSICANTETEIIATTETFSITHFSNGASAKNITTNAFGIITTDFNVFSSLNKNVVAPNSPSTSAFITATSSNGFSAFREYYVRSHLLAFTKTFPTLILYPNAMTLFAEGTGRVAGGATDAVQAAITFTVTGIPGITTFSSATSTISKLWIAEVQIGTTFIPTGPYTIEAAGAGQPTISFSGTAEMALEINEEIIAYTNDTSSQLLKGPNNREIVVSSPMFPSFTVETNNIGEVQLTLPKIFGNIGKSTVTFNCITQNITKTLLVKEKIYESAKIISGSSIQNNILSVLIQSNDTSIQANFVGSNSWNTFLYFNTNRKYRQIDAIINNDPNLSQYALKYNYTFANSFSLPAIVTQGSTYTLRFFGNIGDKCNLKIEGLNSGIIHSSSTIFISNDLYISVTIPANAVFDLLTISANNNYTRLPDYYSHISKVQSGRAETIIEQGLPDLFGWFTAAPSQDFQSALTNTQRVGFGSFAIVEAKPAGLHNYTLASGITTFLNSDSTNKIDQISSVYQKAWDGDMLPFSSSHFLMSDFNLPQTDFSIIQYIARTRVIINGRRFCIPLAIMNENKILNHKLHSNLDLQNDYIFSITLTGQRSSLTKISSDSLITCKLFNEVKSIPIYKPVLFTTNSSSVANFRGPGVVLITTYKKLNDGDEINVYANSELLASFKFNSTYNLSGRIVSRYTDASISAIGIYTRVLSRYERERFMKTTLAEATPFRLCSPETNSLLAEASFYPNQEIGRKTSLNLKNIGIGRGLIKSNSTSQPLKVYENNKPGYFKFNGTSNQLECIDFPLATGAVTTTSVASILNIGIIYKRNSTGPATLIDYFDGSIYFKIEFINDTTLRVTNINGFWTVTIPFSTGITSLVLRNIANASAYSLGTTARFKLALNEFVPSIATYTSSPITISGAARVTLGNNISGYSNNFFNGNIYLIKFNDAAMLRAPGTSTDSAVLPLGVNIAQQNAAFVLAHGFPEIADLIQPTRPIKRLFC